VGNRHSSLISSGLYKSWDWNFKTSKLFSALMDANLNSTGNKNKGAASVISQGRIFNWANGEAHSSGSGFRQDMLNEAQSVPMNVMIYPLIVFSLFSLICISTFFLERIVNCFQRRPIENLNNKEIKERKCFGSNLKIQLVLKLVEYFLYLMQSIIVKLSPGLVHRSIVTSFLCAKITAMNIVGGYK